MKNDRSRALFDYARRFIPGGVNTSIRNLPIDFVWERAEGAYIFDADGNRFIDYHAAFGPPVLGHCNAKVNRAVFDTLERLDLVGTGTTELETKVAEKMCRHIPCAEKVLFTNSGSESTYAAIRLARAVTGRTKIIKFQGCYHGHSDALAMNVISDPKVVGAEAHGPYPHDSLTRGALPEAIANTIVLTFNNIDEVADTLKKTPDIAAIILEPIPHNIGCVLPQQEFLEGLRALTREHGVVLIFDEVITGFRHALGGFQKICGVTPDLATFGKAMANGFPCAAIAGRAELMDQFATAGGPVFFAGTFNGHPLGMAAALATIEAMEKGIDDEVTLSEAKGLRSEIPRSARNDTRGDVHKHLFRLGDKVRAGLTDIIERLKIKAHVAGFGSVFLTYFMEPPIENYHDLLRNDLKAMLDYRMAMLERGIFKLPMNLKRNHISYAHSDADIEATLEAAEVCLRGTA